MVHDFSLAIIEDTKRFSTRFLLDTSITIISIIIRLIISLCDLTKLSHVRSSRLTNAIHLLLIRVSLDQTLSLILVYYTF